MTFDLSMGSKAILHALSEEGEPGDEASVHSHDYTYIRHKTFVGALQHVFYDCEFYCIFQFQIMQKYIRDLSSEVEGHR